MVHSVFSPSSSDALPLDDATIAEAVAPLGYLTGMVGKW
jgi:arylsulfatase A-like enzyme